MGKSVVFYIKVPFEGNMIYVMANSEERAKYNTYEEAYAAAYMWKTYEIVREQDES